MNGAKLLLHGRPRCLPLIRSLVRGKIGIEIGGPSAIFRNWYNLPIYNDIELLDNCDFSPSTTWATHTKTYNFSKSKGPGQVYFCEGSDLHCVADNQYDFLLSSHNLEHFANPVKGLKEWQRVVKPDGHFVLVLPHYARTPDHRRVPTPVSHMLQDYERQTGEDDLTHVEEVFEAYILDEVNERSGSEEKLRAVLMSNLSHRMTHHHAFDELNSRELLESVGLRVLSVETALPFHIILVAQNV
jgi:ubiquinone/menaquinone biosynthesis C-methylase UbiE